MIEDQFDTNNSSYTSKGWYEYDGSICGNADYFFNVTDYDRYQLT